MEKTVSRIVSILFLIIFLPILFCLFVYGNNMNYFDIVKQNYLVHNAVLLPVCLLGILIVFLLKKPLNKIKVIGSAKSSIIFVLCAVLFYVLLFIVNMYIVKCIAFYSGWDASVVAGSVYKLNDGFPITENYYYNIYPFNVSTVYYMYKLYNLAKESADYHYNPEFIWIQTQTVFFSVAGLLTTLSVRRISKKGAPTIFSMLLFAAFVGISPWKIIPYTDTLSFAFGILVIYLYICYRAVKSRARYVLWLVMCLAAFVGAQIKATVYVPLIAVTIIELSVILSRKEVRKKLCEAGICLVIIAACFGTSKLWLSHIYKVTGYNTDNEIGVTWSYLMRLGLNEYSTGGYNSNYSTIIFEYLDRPVKERHAEERRQILEHFKERGFLGSLNFYLRKNVMNYNDGTFCWYLEGNFHPDEYPTLIESRFKQLLRDFFWYEGRFYRYFLTYSQLMWLFTLLLIPVTALHAFVNHDDEYRSMTGAIILTIIGATIFVMLFEGRARYLLNLSPIYVLAASLSLDLPFKKSKE